MRPNSTAMAKVGASSRMPGASSASTHGMASISRIENGTSTSSSAAWAWRAKASASARPWSCSSRENSGHEGRREGALGEQAAEEVRQLEGDEEGVGHGARAQHRRQHDVADEAHEPAQQREAADGGDGAAEAHAGATSSFLGRYAGVAGEREWATHASGAPASRADDRAYVETPPSRAPTLTRWAPVSTAEDGGRGRLMTAIILSSSSAIVSLGGGR